MISTAVIRGEHVRRSAHVVEVDAEGYTWVKSTASTDGNVDCVELANCATRVLVRSSRDRDGARLSYSRPAWTALTAWVTLVR